MCESQYSCHSLENKHSQNVTDIEAGFYQGRKEGRKEKKALQIKSTQL